LAGPRQEDILQGEAQLRASRARLQLLRRQLADADLAAPTDAIVRSRLLEPGEMASPQRPVYTLAITDPKWVRAYVSETDLGRLHPGATAAVIADSFPGRSFPGWVGFISSVAEFTPKAVQTEELRSSLVYEVRVFVKDPKDELRLGMPATVRIALGDQP
jgi:HlyD family secretion protein